VKTFKNFLEEKYINSEAEWNFMILGFVPLNDWIFRSNEINIEIDRAYRVESVDGMRILLKHQGRKKQFPTFTRGSSGLSKGAIVNAEVLLELSGYTFGNLGMDAGTSLDRNGKRWLDLNYFNNGANLFANKIIPKIQKKIGFKYDLDGGNEEYYEVLDKFVEMSGKEKRDFVKWYYKEAKKLITPKLLKNIQDLLKNKDYNKNFDNDEILLHDIKVNKVWFIEEEKDKLIKDEQLLKYLYDEFVYEYDEYSDFIEFLENERPELLKNGINDFVKSLPKDVKFCGFIKRDFIKKIDVSKNKYPWC